jgi:acyl-ACP thioesterase
MRRMAFRVDRMPVFRDDLELHTFCSGTGGRIAERRTTVRCAGAAAVEAVALWVYLDDRGRPAPLADWFFDLYGTAAGGRRVSGRLRLGAPPAGAGTRPWPLRSADFDVLGHVNNAASWTAIEDELERVAPGRVPVAGEIEFRAAVDPGEAIELSSVPAGERLACWLVSDGVVRTAAVVRLGA